MLKISSNVKTDYRGLDRLKKKLHKLEKHEIEWGFLSGSHSQADLSYAALAWLLETGRRQENGTGWEIPPRPAFRQSIQQLRLGNGYERHVQSTLRDYLRPSGNSNLQAFLDSSGRYLADSYKDAMVNWKFNGTAYQSNSPVTIKLKNFDRPYVETGELTQNVQYDIK